MISWKVFVVGFLVSGGVVSLIILIIQLQANEARKLGNFTAQPEQLAGLLKLPKEDLKFQWLEEPESTRGISVPSAASPSTPMLTAVAEEKSGKTWISVYLNQNYKERLEVDPARANTFLNTHLIQAYLISKHEVENLSEHFDTFCEIDCQLEYWSVVQ